MHRLAGSLIAASILFGPVAAPAQDKALTIFAAASMTRNPSGMTSLPIPSPGMTAIRYVFLLLIENVLVIWLVSGLLICLAL